MYIKKILEKKVQEPHLKFYLNKAPPHTNKCIGGVNKCTLIKVDKVSIILELINILLIYFYHGC